MQYHEFIHAARERLGLETPEAVVNVARAFLHTLTEHLAGNTADNLAAQLPAELAQLIREIDPEERDQGQRFKLSEFYIRMARRTGTDDATARRYTHGFMDVLARSISEGEVQKLRKVLSADYAELFANLPGMAQPS